MEIEKEKSVQGVQGWLVRPVFPALLGRCGAESS